LNFGSSEFKKQTSTYICIHSYIIIQLKNKKKKEKGRRSRREEEEG